MSWRFVSCSTIYSVVNDVHQQGIIRVGVAVFFESLVQNCFMAKTDTGVLDADASELGMAILMTNSFLRAS